MFPSISVIRFSLPTAVHVFCVSDQRMRIFVFENVCLAVKAAWPRKNTFRVTVVVLYKVSTDRVVLFSQRMGTRTPNRKI